jgi:tRNA-uridine 2-sulfurtransferase
MWKARVENDAERDYTLDDIVLLKVGRHLRPKENFKVIIAREEGESNYLSGYRKEYISLKARDFSGPLALIDGKASNDDLELAARLVARYGKGRDEDKVQMDILCLDGSTKEMLVSPLASDEVPKQWYV